MWRYGGYCASLSHEILATVASQFILYVFYTRFLLIKGSSLLASHEKISKATAKSDFFSIVTREPWKPSRRNFIHFFYRCVWGTWKNTMWNLEILARIEIYPPPPPTMTPNFAIFSSSLVPPAITDRTWKNSLMKLENIRFEKFIHHQTKLFEFP